MTDPALIQDTPLVLAPILGPILAGALAGGFINGLAGFGTALLALGFFLQVLPPVQAVGLTVAMSVTTGLPGIWVIRKTLFQYPRRTTRFLLPSLAGIPLGIAALAYVDPDWLRLLIAGFLILYGVFFLARGSLPQFDRDTPRIDRLIGFAGGILGGLAGLSGALPAMWCALRPWPRHETRAVLQPFNFVILAISTVILAFRGAYPSQVWPVLVLAIVTAGISGQVGIFVFKRLTDTAFRWLLIGLMLLSGIVLLMRTLLY